MVALPQFFAMSSLVDNDLIDIVATCLLGFLLPAVIGFIKLGMADTFSHKIIGQIVLAYRFTAESRQIVLDSVRQVSMFQTHKNHCHDNNEAEK